MVLVRGPDLEYSCDPEVRGLKRFELLGSLVLRFSLLDGRIVGNVDEIIVIVLDTVD